jgi:hypothetical protein
MKTITLTFTKNIQGSELDPFGNPIETKQAISVEGCLIAPITEPSSHREEQAIEQGKIQVRIHLPKTFTGDVSDSDVEWGGKTFHLDSDSVAFMNENCPTKWNRYFRAEAIYE